MGTWTSDWHLSLRSSSLDRLKMAQEETEVTGLGRLGLNGISLSLLLHLPAT